MLNMTPVQNGNHTPSNVCSPWPAFLDTIQLNKAVQENIGKFERIVKVEPSSASSVGENYSSLLMRLNVEVELLDGSRKTISFILKAQHSNEAMAKILDTLQLFPKEEEMYHKIMPKLEELYKDAGKEIKFGPQAYKFDHDVGVDYILLEDLRIKNYQNANRLVGLDMDHIKMVLTKLAQFHAASACYVEHFGMFDTPFTVSIFTEKNLALLKEFNVSTAFLMQLKKWKNCQQYFEKLEDSDDYLVNRLLQNQKVDPSEFNVLNHGDCWSNNIMFQYDAFGKIKNVLFVDFQVSKYGSPANDLYYFLLSSAAKDIKLTQFDYMIRFYYDNLVKNLKLLQYHRPLPKLRNLHATLLKNGLAAYMVVTKVMPIVILEKNENANLENYMEDESKLKTAMYTNPKYVQAMAEILPWLDNRGLLDFK